MKTSKVQNLYFVRHAYAGSKLPLPDDATRPLEKKGIKQSRHLARLLKNKKIDELYCSPYKRCVQTIKPIEKIVGLSAKIIPELSPEHVKNSSKFVEQIIKNGPSNCLICTHGENLDYIMKTLFPTLHGSKNYELKKGSLMTLCLENGKIVKSRYHPTI